MNNYCDSEFYYETYGGTVVPQNEIDKWLLLASNTVRQCILNRDITPFETLVKKATCNVAEILYNQNERITESLKGGNISSEHIGDYSRTYANTTTEGTYSSGKYAIKQTLDMYLGCTGLMYRGLDV